MSKLGTLGARLHHGEIGYDFVRNRVIWYGLSVLITIAAILGLSVRGLHMGIEFQGGAVFTTPKNMSASVSQAEGYAEDASGHDAIVQKLGDGSLRIQIAGIDTGASDDIKRALATDLKVDAERINADLVGPSWGEQIANKAWKGLAIFMVLVVIYLAIAFEWRMAVAAFVALVHDLTITTGVYALVGFEVTPATVYVLPLTWVMPLTFSMMTVSPLANPCAAVVVTTAGLALVMLEMNLTFGKKSAPVPTFWTCRLFRTHPVALNP